MIVLSDDFCFHFKFSPGLNTKPETMPAFVLTPFVGENVHSQRKQFYISIFRFLS